jgi:dTDP-4-amino-4,6-dideoxygalactose transaminase
VDLLGEDDLLIPLHVPELGPDEWSAVGTAVQEGHIVGNGVIGRRAQSFMEATLPAKHVILTTSCTHAMELAMLAAGVGSGDEVICPSFTFPSTANAIALRGASPVFADITSDTLTLDPADVARRITPRTRAIMPVHYAGVVDRVDELRQLADYHHLLVVEDAAQAWGSRWRGQSAGVLGDVGCFSFHATKNVTCGEGGAFVTNDEALFRAAEIVAEKGTNRNAFLRGEVDRYTWVALGSSYVLSDVLAALLLAQLRRSDEINAVRRKKAERYTAALRPLQDAGLARLPYVPAECNWNAHGFFLVLEDAGRRDLVVEKLRAEGIGAAMHFVPLHDSPYWTAQSHTHRLPVTEHAAAGLIRLPLFVSLSEADQDHVIGAVLRIVRDLAPTPDPLLTAGRAAGG